MTLSIARVRCGRTRSTTTTCRVLVIDVIILVMMVVVMRSCLRSSGRILPMIRGGGGLLRLAVHGRGR